ncbi:HAD-IIA family hydrolase [soil metagenome]
MTTLHAYGLDAVDVVLCDLDGVVWLSHIPIDGAVDAVTRIRDTGRRIVFVTNSSALTIAEHTAALARIGIEAPGDVLSSASAVVDLVAPGERVLVCGGNGIDEAVGRAGGVAIAGDDDDAVAVGVDLVIVGFHREFDYHRLQLATDAIRAGARFVATNRDPLYPSLPRPIPGSGAIVAAVSTATGVDPVVTGKPSAAMASTVVHLLQDGEGEVDVGAKVLMVGDMVSTDGAFAELLGCRFALVRSGNTAPGEPVPERPAFDGADLAEVADALESSGPAPTRSGVVTRR